MIHQYKAKGFNIVLDTYSGSVHAVDDVTYQIISLYEENTKEEIKNTWKQMKMKIQWVQTFEMQQKRGHKRKVYSNTDPPQEARKKKSQNTS